MLTFTARPRSLGQIFTRRWVAEALLDLVGYTRTRPLETLRLVEPSVGEGAFLAPILERLLDRALGVGVPLADLSDCLRCFDLDPAAVATSRALCVEALTMAGATPDEADRLSGLWVQHGDYLLADRDADGEADVVVGNPPYVRYDDLPAGAFADYQQAWPTLSGRGDIYVGFWERALTSLKPGGVVGYICADRWMRNSYGARLREFVGARFNVRAVWSMHDVDAFERSVSSYPAITVIGAGPQGRVATADTTAQFGDRQAEALTRWTLGRALSGDGTGWRAHRLSHWYTGPGLWPAGNPDQLALLDDLDHLPTLEQAGVKVGIGLASGADQVYVTTAAAPIEPDRLLPMVTNRSLTTDGRIRWAGEHLASPWTADGRLVDLADYPQLAAYLSSAPGIADRFVARKNPAGWHRTIDKVIPRLARTPKLLIPDMRPALIPYFDEGTFYPHHNLYWMTSPRWDLEVLGGILLSDIAGAFIEAHCVRMRGGTLRLQAQYLRTIRVPKPETIPATSAEALRAAFRTRDRAAATAAARAAYGLGSKAAA